MPATNTVSTLNGFFKQIYGDSLLNLIPENAKLLKKIPFERKKKLGDYYNVPVVLQAENGFTYNNGDGSAFALLGSNAMATKNAIVRGSEKVLQSQISYKAAAAATSSKEAFADATSTLFENMMESMSNREELSCWYGGTWLGTGSGSGSTSANSSIGAATFARSTTTITVTTANNHGFSTGMTVPFTDDSGSSVASTGTITVTGAKTFTVTSTASGTVGAGAACTLSPFVGITSTTAWIYIDRDEWSTGLWAGKIGAMLNFYQDDDSTLISSGSDAVFEITAIDNTYKRIKVTGTSTGISALLAVTKANFDGGSSIYFQSSKGKDFLGVSPIITTSGSLFGIDNSIYSLWKGVEYTGSGALTMNMIIQATENAVNQGLNEDVTAYVPVASYNSLMTDLAAFRKFDSSYKSKEGENGFESVTFYGANGKIRVEPHTIVKNGEVFIIPEKQFIRVGATDVTFQTPGMDAEEIFLQLPSNAGYEVRAYADQALLCMAPSRCTKLTGFTVS